MRYVIDFITRPKRSKNMPSPDSETKITGQIWLHKSEHRFLGGKYIELLRQIGESGSITQAARAVSMSYKAAWEAVNTMNNLAEQPLVVSETGGKHGGGSRVTAYGRRQIHLFSAAETEYQKFLRRLSESIQGGDTSLHFMRRLLMQTSARNEFAGRVASLFAGPINAEVTVDLGNGDAITALITKNSADRLGLSQGSEVLALVKASSIIITSGSENIKFSTRNLLRGAVLSCKQGAVNTEVTLQLAGGKTLAAIITNESVDRLGLKEGSSACAIFKSSSVILGVVF